jgi:hypothetical protein
VYMMGDYLEGDTWWVELCFYELWTHL